MEKDTSSKIKTRMLEHVNYLKISKRSFYIKTGIANGVLDKTTGLTEENIMRYIDAYPEINPTWLITGRGSMFNLVDSYRTKEPFANYEIKYPLISLSVLPKISDPKFVVDDQYVKEYYQVPKFRNKHVDFLIELEDSSMYPTYNSGDIIACRILRNNSFIQWNKTHLIVTDNNEILIKRIKKGEDEASLHLLSDNKDFDPFDISTQEISGLALVVGSIRIE